MDVIFWPPTLPPITSTLIQNIIFALRVQNRACGKNEVFSYSKYYSYTPSGAFFCRHAISHDKNGNLHALLPKNVWGNRSEFEPPFWTSLIPSFLESWVIYPALLVIRLRDKIDFWPFFRGLEHEKFQIGLGKKNQGGGFHSSHPPWL